MASAYVFRIGPIDGTPPTQRYLYVPIFNDVALDELVFAPDDETGLLRIKEAVGTFELVCHPVLAEAAERLGMATEEPSHMLRELRAELALSVGSEERFPETRPLIVRRILLRGLGALSRSFVWDLMVLGAKTTAQVAGEIAGHAVDMQLACAVEPSEIGVARIRIHQHSGSVGDGAADALILLADGPAYVVEALMEGYGLRFRPEFDGLGGNDNPNDVARLCATAGHVFHSLGVLPPGDDIIRTTLDLDDVRLRTEAELGPIKPP
jgi:hypothetical protein